MVICLGHAHCNARRPSTKTITINVNKTQTKLNDAKQRRPHGGRERGKGEEVCACVTGAKVLRCRLSLLNLTVCLSLPLTVSQSTFSSVSFYVYLALIRKLRFLFSLNETFDIKFNLRLFESRPKSATPLPRFPREGAFKICQRKSQRGLIKLVDFTGL